MSHQARARVLEQLLQRAVDDSDVWVTTLAEVAAHVRSLDLPPRTLSRPEGF